MHGVSYNTVFAMLYCTKIMQYIYYYNTVQYVISKCNSKYQHQLFLQYYYYTTNAHVRDNKQDRIEILSLASLTLDS